MDIKLSDVYKAELNDGVTLRLKNREILFFKKNDLGYGKALQLYNDWNSLSVSHPSPIYTPNPSEVPNKDLTPGTMRYKTHVSWNEHSQKSTVEVYKYEVIKEFPHTPSGNKYFTSYKLEGHTGTSPSFEFLSNTFPTEKSSLESFIEKQQNHPEYVNNDLIEQATTILHSLPKVKIPQKI